MNKHLSRLIPLVMIAALLIAGMTALAAEEPAEAPDLIQAEAAAGAGVSAGGDDNDALFAGYAQRQFYGVSASTDGPALDGGHTGDRLEGLARTLYDLLREYIRQVAAGERTSTAFEITPEDLFGEEYTCDDLDAAFKYLDAKDNNARIVNCLLADLPYDLYWYDKTYGYTYTSFNYSYYDYGDHRELIKPVGSMTFYMACAADYAAPAEQEDYYQLYEASAAGQTVNRAVEKARQIVRQYADAPDLEKLNGYRIEICRLASYNDIAAGYQGYPYGDPWQLIHVFDGDPDTTVVCEGYAKAFQYLCDLTAFTSGNIECRLVSGLMSGGTGAGDHMWNIVHMDDGANYLADVTNCDGDSIGAPDLLFLKGYSAGSQDTEYFFLNGSTSYAYDAETRGLYTVEELTLSASDYDPANVPEPTPTPTPTPVPVGPFDAAVILQKAAGLPVQNAPASDDVSEAARILAKLS